jgi:hypothetical protein
MRVFISLEKCFCTVFFLRIFRGYFDCTCALSHQSLCAGIVYEHYCLCPGWPCARRSSLCTLLCREYGAVKRNGHVCNKYLTLIHPPTIIGLVDQRALCKINNRNNNNNNNNNIFISLSLNLFRYQRIHENNI